MRIQLLGVSTSNIGSLGTSDGLGPSAQPEPNQRRPRLQFENLGPLQEESTVFGLLRPCSHILDENLREQWRAHMCGLCLALRDGHGQASRMTTNTDAVMISILTAAQQEPGYTTRTAGPCPFRGMRRAEVIASHEPGVALATASSLALATAKAEDVVAEQRLGLAPNAPVKQRVAAIAAGTLRRKNAASTALDADAVLRPLARQAVVECTSTDLYALTEPTASACAAVFESSARLADAPANAGPLADIGAEYGRIAHLIDAVDDRADDVAAGSFNPLVSTGTTDREALRQATTSADAIAQRYRELVLHDDRLLKALLINGVAQAIRARTRSLTRHRCGSRSDTSAQTRPGWPETPPDDYPSLTPYPPPFPPNRSWIERSLPFVGVTCCGPALCTNHWNHCTDEFNPAFCEDHCDCDGCSACGDCCDCSSCCDC